MGFWRILPSSSELGKLVPRTRRRAETGLLWATALILTLGPKFYIFSVLSPRICFCFENPFFLAGSAAFFEILLLAVSKHVLKPSGAFFRKFACGLGFAGYVFHELLPPEGD